MSATALSFYQRIADPLQAVEKFGEIIAKSGMFGVDSIEKGQLIALTLLSEGITPADFKAKYHIIAGGTLAMRADYMLAEFMRLGGSVEWLSGLGNCTAAAGVWNYGANKDKELQYTIEDAKREGLSTKNKTWTTSTPDMLRARLISKAVRMLAPQVNSGSYTAEELEGTLLTASAGNSDTAQVSAASQAPLLPPTPPISAAEAKPSEKSEAAEAGKKTQADSRNTLASEAPSATQAEAIPSQNEPSAVTNATAESSAWVLRLVQAFEGIDEAPINYLLTVKGWIKEGQTFRNLSSAEQAEAIFSRLPSFLAKAKEEFSKKGAQ